MSKEITPDKIVVMRARLARLTPEMNPKWGIMTPNELVTHLTDALRHPVGDKPAKLPPRSFVRNFLQKWLVLWVFPRMPKGVQTRATADPRRDGTKPVEFTRDMAELNSVTDRYLAQLGTIAATKEHTRFGPMREKDWLRWWWMHMDHHMRQFGL
jgi:hypothetical protein